MAYKKDQGRYARMLAFWSVALLLAYGFLGSFPVWVRRNFGGDQGFESWGSYPVVGQMDAAVAAGLAGLGICAFILHRLLSKPKTADLLIETEDEMKKVTWPTRAETWNGSVAVMVTVLVLLAFLWGSEMLLAAVFQNVLGGAAA